MTSFFLLPSMLLSGVTIPFRGMPDCARVLGSVLPLTHVLVLVRDILAKGIGADLLWSHAWPIPLFMGTVPAPGLKIFRRALD